MADQAESKKASFSVSSSTVSTTTASTGTSNRYSNHSKKILVSLQRIPLNKSCADCRAPFVDPSSIWVSFSPLSPPESPAEDSESQQQNDQPPVRVSFHNFGLTHEAFAPPEDVQAKKSSPEQQLSSPGDGIKNKNKKSTTKKKKSKKTLTNNAAANQRIKLRWMLGGHGAFLCPKCAEAHHSLGSHICEVKLACQMTSSEATWMERSGGNERCNLVYERYINDMWKQRKPVPLSQPDVRQTYCRAKYEALAFILPPPGPLAPSAWGSILQRNKSFPWSSSPELRDIMAFSPGAQLREDQKGRRTSGLKDQLPNRLLDHFCIVSSSMRLQQNACRQVSGLHQREMIEGLALVPQVSDCFPDRNAHSDMEFPEHIANFVMPLGCHPSLDPKPPTFHFQVLTTSESEYLFCGCLIVYDESIDVQTLRQDLIGNIPEGSSSQESFHEFLRQEYTDIDDEDDDDSVVFLPKCLVLISHHPFFDLWRHMLLGLYQRSLTGSPLPLERYIANAVCEWPLPPHGRVKVEFKGLSIERPAPNKLPMANISFRPLFASLSVGNIMVVLSFLMQESKVVVHSSSLSIIMPVMEALRSALFPFLWQGIFIPCLPLSLVELLDAPVPFFVGVHNDYMKLVDPSRQPSDVVFVDLDRDVVKIGELSIPVLPTKAASKLQNALETSGGSAAYLVPNSGIKGCIMAGKSDTVLVANKDRPTYAYMTTMTGLSASSLGRNEVLLNTDLAYRSSKISTFLLAFVGQDHGHLSNEDIADQNVESSTKRAKSLIPIKSPMKNFNKASKTRKILSRSDAAMSTLVSGDSHLLDIGDSEQFSTKDIRNAFLRFIVSIFSNYEEYISSRGDNDVQFDLDGFLRDGQQGSYFTRAMCESQMFQTFLREKQQSQTYEIQFFDEQIRAKMNRSKRETLRSGGKQETPFLDDDTTWKVTQTYRPPEPNKLGLPDKEMTYAYPSFPTKLDPRLYGTVRDPVSWPQIRDRSSLQLVKRRRAAMMKSAMKGLGSAPKVMMTAMGRTAKDFDSMMFGMSTRKENKEMSQSETAKTNSSGVKAIPLSKIDTIVMNSRRKQMLILNVVVILQACWRGYIARKQLSSIKTSENSARNDHIKEEETRIKARQQRAAAVKIQTAHRRVSATTRWQNTKRRVVTIQSRIRSRRARLLYIEMRMMIVRVQASIRGWKSRTRMRRLTKSLISMYKRHIPTFWVQTQTALTLRAKLWCDLTQDQQGYLNVRLAQRELERLWILLGLDLKSSSNLTDQITKDCDRLGVDSKTYRICLLCDARADIGKQTSESVDLNSSKVVETERLQVYERLSQNDSDEAASVIYQRFDIPAREKLKKMSVAQRIFSDQYDVDLSVCTMMELFPELKSNSLVITYRAPSTKGLRRFKNADKNSVPPIDSSLWDSISREGTIKRHVKEVSMLFISKVPALQRRLDGAKKTDPALYESTISFRNALVKSHHATSWKDLKCSVLKQYLVQ